MTAIVQLPSVAGPSRRRKLPWWLCPSNRELSLRSEIKMGYSTIGSKIAKNRHSPLVGSAEVIKISDKELSIIKAVLAKAREMEKVIQMRAESLMLEYDTLKGNVRGNGENNCILCGYDPLISDKKLQLITCDKCGKIACTVCHHRKRLQSGIVVLMCKLCYDFQELWCKTGAWMTNRLPEKMAPDEEIKGYLKEGRRGTLGSDDRIFGEVEVQLDQGYLTPEEEAESEDDLLKSGATSSYKNVKFTDLGSNENDSRSPTPMAMITEITEGPLIGRRGSNPQESRRRALSAENRGKLSEIRDRVKTKVAVPTAATNLTAPQTLLPHDASFDSQDSDFEPLKIHESMEEKEADMNIIISTPSKEESAPFLTIVEEDEEEAKSKGKESDSDDTLGSDNSDFEYGDIELPRGGSSFSRFGRNRAPVVRKTRNSEDATDSEKDTFSKRGSTEEELSDVPFGVVNEDEKQNISLQQIGDSSDDSDLEPPTPSVIVTKSSSISPTSPKDIPVSVDVHIPVDDTPVPVDIPLPVDIPVSVDIPVPVDDIPIPVDIPVPVDISVPVDDTPVPVDIPIDTTIRHQPKEEDTIQQQLGNESDNIVTNPEASSQPSSTSSSANSSPRKRLQVTTSSGEDISSDQDSFRWKRRNATRNSTGMGGRVSRKRVITPSNVTTPTNTSEGTESQTTQQDESTLSKREKARMAARRLREGNNGKGKLMSRSKRIQDDDDNDVLDFVTPPPDHVDLNDHKEDQLI